MAHKKKKTFQQESTYASLPRYFWRQFERAIDLLVHLLLLLQSKQVKRIPQDSIHELIIWKMNPLVVPVTGVKFCMRNEQWIFYENFSVFSQTENLWMD